MFKFLALNKSLGESSFKALSRVKKYFNTKKVGHLGTLDPLAEGVLVVAVGEATKLIPYVEIEPKEYVVEVFFGYETETLDAEGVDKEAVRELADKVSIKLDELKVVLEELRQAETQFPPKYSAIKIEGNRAYDLARKGILDESKIKSKPVKMYSFEILNFSLPIAKLRIQTSSGYYVRSLVRDMAEKLGVKAFMYSLIRTKVGGFDLERCSDFDSDLVVEYPLCDIIKDFYRINVTDEEYKKLRNGIAVGGIEIDSDKEIAYIYNQNNLVSLVKVDKLKSEIIPIKNFNL